MNFDYQQFAIQQQNCDTIIHQLEDLCTILLDCGSDEEANCIKTCIDSLNRVYDNRIINHPDFLTNPQLAQQLKNKPKFATLIYLPSYPQQK